jgi:hypothetical protein
MPRYFGLEGMLYLRPLVLYTAESLEVTKPLFDKSTTKLDQRMMTIYWYHSATR